MYLLTLVHSTPPVCKCAGLPLTLVATPSTTVVTSEQVSGQSCGQAPMTVVVEAVVMVGAESSYRYFAAHRKPRGTPARSIASCPCHIATRATSRKGYPRGFLARHLPRFAAP